MEGKLSQLEILYVGIDNINVIQKHIEKIELNELLK
jgi:hypothetical protein|tara:strand:- start:1874 stop:1981 length:108 start_codon:yes stop_codon:yes gene_type:complete